MLKFILAPLLFQKLLITFVTQMKIAHVTYGLGMGGIETMLVNITRFQAAEGHEVHLIVLNDIVDPSLVASMSPDVKLRLIGRPRGSRNPLHIVQLNEALRRIKPDVVHLHYSSLSRYIFLPSLKKRMCVTLHSMCTPGNSVRLDKSGPVFAISDMVRHDIALKTGLEAVTVHNGIDLAGIKRRAAAGAQEEGTFRIVQVGRLLHDIKGQDILIRAVAQLLAEGRDVSLTLIGDGESRPYLEDIVRELKITGRVEFAGTRPQSYVLGHIADFNLFVQPSRLEGFGLTVAEAMAAGVPVLVSDNDGPLEIIDGGRYGFSFRRDDVADCARMIATVMDNYPSREFLDAAARRVETDFNVSTTARRYLSLYSSMLSQD